MVMNGRPRRSGCAAGPDGPQYNAQFFVTQGRPSVRDTISQTVVDSDVSTSNDDTSEDQTPDTDGTDHGSHA